MFLALLPKHESANGSAHGRICTIQSKWPCRGQVCASFFLSAFSFHQRAGVEKGFMVFPFPRPFSTDHQSRVEVVPQTYIFDCAFLMGDGAKSKQRLPPELAIRALDLVQKDPCLQNMGGGTHAPAVRCVLLFGCCFMLFGVIRQRRGNTPIAFPGCNAPKTTIQHVFQTSR